MHVMSTDQSCTPTACVPPSEHGPGCGCGTAATASPNTDGMIAKTATASALAAVACTSCCVLPFILPAVVLANIGGWLAILDHAHVWVTRAAMVVVTCAWGLIGYRFRAAGRRPSHATLMWMALASLLTLAAASWPIIEPVVFHALGIVKKRGG